VTDLTPVEITRSFKKRLERKTPEMQDAVLACVRQLRIDWRHPGLRAKKLSGTDYFEARVSRGGRLTFIWDGPKIVLLNHCHHDILKAL
jgi:mRNA interferase RelE/StbE